MAYPRQQRHRGPAGDIWGLWCLSHEKCIHGISGVLNLEMHIHMLFPCFPYKFKWAQKTGIGCQRCRRYWKHSNRTSCGVWQSIWSTPNLHLGQHCCGLLERILRCMKIDTLDSSFEQALRCLARFSHVAVSPKFRTRGVSTVA